jgi:hypothetical protein
MSVRCLGVVAVVIVCLGGLALAQDEELPVSNWGAPPYWTPQAVQPSEGATRGGMLAQAQGMTAQTETLPSSPLPFVAIAPCRIVDTRQPVSDGFHQPNFGDDDYRTFPFPSSPNCTGLPATAGAWSINIQFRPLSQLAYLTAYPTGTTTPLVSTMTAGPAAWVQNAAIVPAGTGGAIDVYCQYAGRVVIDINGYYGPQSVVTSLNTKTGDVTLAQGSNVTITPSGHTLTIAASAGPGGELPAGSANQTLRNNGSAWVASSALANDGADIGITGNLLLPSTTSAAAAGVVFLGSDPFLHNYGPVSAGNTFVGQQAGNFTTTFGGNTGVGYESLSSNTTGADNSGIGYQSLAANTYGNDNTASGWGGLANNTSGSYNTANGSSALYHNTSGASNTAMGFLSLLNNTTAGQNTAVGVEALRYQSYSNSNVQWSSYNTALGFEALRYNQPNSPDNGVRNTAVGGNALAHNTTGFRNTAVGADAGSRSDTAAAYGGGTATFVHSVTGSFNTFVGYGTGTTVEPVANCTAVGVDAYCTADNQVRLGNAWVTSIGGQVEWSALSDIRAKREVRALDFGLEFLMQLRPVAYVLRNGNGKTDTGFVAQDIEALLGDGYNVLDVGGDPERTLSLRGTELIAPLVKAVQEQQAEIQTLKAALAAREAESAQLKALVNRVAKLEEEAHQGANRPRVAAGVR